MRQQLGKAKPTDQGLAPQETSLAADVTFWGKHYGVCVFRSPTLRKNLWWTEVEQETPAVYLAGLDALGGRGWKTPGIVVDGKRGVAKLCERQGLRVQICHFHQEKAVTKHLTRKPKTDAGRMLRTLTLTLPHTNEDVFTTALARWHKRYKVFLEHRSLARNKRGWVYTHQRVRSAYRSLITNLPYLFTYQKYPELHLPNTTNCLDGMFSQLKNRLNVHRGAKKEFRYKLIGEILSGSN